MGSHSNLVVCGSKDVRARVVELSELSKATTYESSDDGLRLSKQALEIAAAARDPELIALSLHARSWAHFGARNYNEAHNDACESLRHAMISRNERTISISYLLLGIVAYQNGDLIDSQDSFESVLKFAQAANDEELEAKAFANLACVCYRLKDSDSAIEYSMRALAALPTHPKAFRENLLRSNLVEHYLQAADRLDVAQEHEKKWRAIDLANQQLAVLFGRPELLSTTGLHALAEANSIRIAIHKHDLSDIRTHLRKLRAIGRNSENGYEHAILSTAEGNVASFHKRFVLAGKHYARAAEFFGPIGEGYFECAARESAFLAFRKANRIREALFHAEWILNAREVFSANSCQRRAQVLKIKLEVEKSLKEKEILETTNTLLQDRAQELERQANTDVLTQVLNRRGFDQALRDSEGVAFKCIATIDIDNFKWVNDTFGHAVGDEVLRLISRIFVEELRESNHIGRIGGEEFALILSGTSLESAETVCERLRARVQNYTWRLIADGLSVTISIGLKEWTFGTPTELAIHLADDSLYVAKRNGRNCVVTDSKLRQAAA